jgi:predicted transposase YbfD/YdcC
MSEAHLKLFINDLYYVASLPIKTTMRTISYYTNLSEELETDKALISSLKTELKLKDNIISIQDIRLETEIEEIIKNEIAKNEFVMMRLMNLSQQNEYLNEELEKERSLTASLKEVMKKERSLIASLKEVMKLSQQNEYLKEELEKERSLTASLKEELEQSKNTNRCSNCFINNITINVPCQYHSYCISCMIEKNNCIVCKSYLMFHKKI